MPWTNVSKPGAQTWNDSHPQGKEQYDESSITYDDASTFYDGINPSQWSDVNKPSTNAWVTVAKPT